MSVVYKTNNAYDYRRYEEQPEEPQQAAPKRPPVPRSAVMLRRALMFFVAVFVAAVCIGLLYVKAQVYMAQRQVNDTQKDILAAQRLNGNLTEQLNEAIGINTIMEKASILGMGYATADQILYVDLVTGDTAGIEMKTGN